MGKNYIACLYRTQSDLDYGKVTQRAKVSGTSDSNIIEGLSNLLDKRRFRAALLYNSDNVEVIRMLYNGLGNGVSVYRIYKAQQRISNMMSSLLELFPNAKNRIEIMEISSGKQFYVVDSETVEITDRTKFSRFFKEVGYISKPVISVSLDVNSMELEVQYENDQTDTYYLQNGILYNRVEFRPGDEE